MICLRERFGLHGTLAIHGSGIQTFMQPIFKLCAIASCLPLQSQSSCQQGPWRHRNCTLPGSTVSSEVAMQPARKFSHAPTGKLIARSLHMMIRIPATSHRLGAASQRRIQEDQLHAPRPSAGRGHWCHEKCIESCPFNVPAPSPTSSVRPLPKKKRNANAHSRAAFLMSI